MKERNYTSGPIGKTMLKTGFAMLAGTLAMSGYNIADTYFVGNLEGKTPLAAMGFTFPVIMLIVCIFRGITVGIMTTTAQSIGRKKMDKAALITTSGLALVILFSLLITIAGIATGNLVFGLMGAKGETLTQTLGYMDIWYYGCVTAFLCMTKNDLLIASGDSRMASILMMAGLVLNVILDPIFIFGFGPVPAMGIRGAAIATVIAQGISAVIGAYVLYRKGFVVFQLFPFRKLRESWKLIIRFAIPSSLGMLMMPIGAFVVTWVVAQFGDAAVAAVAAASRIEMVAFVFPMALGMSLMPMVGQNYGARLYTRIHQCRRFAMRFALLFLFGMAVIYYFAASFIAQYFSTDKEVREIMVIFLVIVPWGFGMVEVHRYSGFFFTGCGHPTVAAIINGLRVVLMIPLTFLALYWKSLEGIFWARLASDILSGGIGMYLAKRMTDKLPEDGIPCDTKGVMKYLFPALPGKR